MTHRLGLAMFAAVLVMVGCTATEPAGTSNANAPTTGQLDGTASSASGLTPQADGTTELPSGEPVTEWGLAAPDRLIVWYSGCESNVPVTIDETDERVLVLISGPNGLCEPLFAQELELAAPLGDRAVVDRSTGSPAQRNVFGPPSSDALARAQERWATAAISDYRLRVVATSGQVGSMAATFVVRDGELRSRSEHGRMADERLDLLPGTVEELFTLIASASRDERCGSAEYDVETGYPTKVVLMDDPQDAPNGTTWFISFKPTEGVR